MKNIEEIKKAKEAYDEANKKWHSASYEADEALFEVHAARKILKEDGISLEEAKVERRKALKTLNEMTTILHHAQEAYAKAAGYKDYNDYFEKTRNRKNTKNKKKQGWCN